MTSTGGTGKSQSKAKDTVDDPEAGFFPDNKQRWNRCCVGSDVCSTRRDNVSPVRSSERQHRGTWQAGGAYSDVRKQ